MPTSLDTAIAEAAAELTRQAKNPAVTPQAEVPVEITEDETPTEEITTESGEEAPESDAAEADELSTEQLAEAKRVYKILNDPSQRGPLIAALAQQSGILTALGDRPTRTEVAAAKKEVTEILGDALGEYKFLAPKLGPAIEAILAQERETQQQGLAEIQQAQIERDVVTVTDKLRAETKGVSKQFETRMSELANEIPAGNMGVETYVRRLFAIAQSERRPAPQALADKIRRNSADASVRLAPGTQGQRSPGIEMPTKKMNLDESINWAAQQLGMAGKRK